MSADTALPAGRETGLTPPGDARSPRLVRCGLAALLVAGILAIYWNVGSYPFVNFDDTRYVTMNEHVLGGLSPDGLRWALTSTEVSNWHPLTWWSHMLDVELFGVHAGGHHLTGVFWHALGAVFLFLFLLRTTAHPWAAFCVAAFFAWHPLRVESVAWVSERKDVLSGFFAFLALYLYAGYAKRPTFLAYAGVLCSLVLGLMAKSMLVTLPCLFLLIDAWPLRRTATLQRRLWEKLPFFACSLLTAWITLVAQRSSGATDSLGAVDWHVRLLNSFASLATYVRLTLWPTELACLYPHPALYAEDPAGELLPAALLGGALILAAATVAYRLRRAFPMLWVGGLWTLGTLVPVIGLKQVGVQAHADRYTYLPMIGLVLAGVYVVSVLVARWQRIARTLLGVAVGLLLMGYAVAARGQVAVWESADRIWERCLAVTEGNFTAHNNLGRLQATRGELDSAEEHFRAALEIRPGETPDPQAAGVHRNLSGVLRLTGRPRDYVEEMELAIALNPEHLPYREELAIALAGWRQEAQAIEHLQGALRIAPGKRNLRNLLAELLAGAQYPGLRNGALAKALALELCKATGYAQPTFLATLAAAHAELGEFPDAIARQRAALERSGPGKQEEMRERLELYLEEKAWRRRP